MSAEEGHHHRSVGHCTPKCACRCPDCNRMDPQIRDIPHCREHAQECHVGCPVWRPGLGKSGAPGPHDDDHHEDDEQDDDGNDHETSR